jgi:hypothetical protein
MLGAMTRASTRKTGARRGVTFETVRKLALALPGVEEGSSYGTAAFKAKGKLLARLKEDGETLVVRIDMEAREGLMQSDPETYFITDHYANYPAMLVRLGRVSEEALGALLEEAWRTFAPKSLVNGAAKKAVAPAKKAAKKSPKRAAKAASTPESALARVRELCLSLPGVEETVGHSRPCFAAKGKTFVMFMDNHHGDGRLALWLKAPPGAQQMLVESAPDRFFVPPYVGPRGWVGARLETPDWNEVGACIEEAYRMSAPKGRAPKR